MFRATEAGAVPVDTLSFFVVRRRVEGRRMANFASAVDPERWPSGDTSGLDSYASSNPRYIARDCVPGGYRYRANRRQLGEG